MPEGFNERENPQNIEALKGILPGDWQVAHPDDPHPDFIVGYDLQVGRAVVHVDGVIPGNATGVEWAAGAWYFAGTGPLTDSDLSRQADQVTRNGEHYDTPDDALRALLVDLLATGWRRTVPVMNVAIDDLESLLD